MFVTCTHVVMHSESSWTEGLGNGNIETKEKWFLSLIKFRQLRAAFVSTDINGFSRWL